MNRRTRRRAAEAASQFAGPATDQTTEHLAPPGRIDALDALRGFAVFGILLRNIFVFGMPAAAYALPLEWSGTAAGIATYAFTEIFVDGAMRALFCLLFGASALLMLSTAAEQGTNGPDYFMRRQFGLMTFGLIHAFLLLSAVDILFVYGALGMMVFPLRNLTPRVLLSLAAALMAASIVLPLIVDELTTFENRRIEAQAGMTKEKETPSGGAESGTGTPTGATEIPGRSDDRAARPGDDGNTAGSGESSTSDADDSSIPVSWANTIAERQQSYLYNLLILAEASLENMTSDLFTSHFTDVGVFILLGMALFKLGFFTNQQPIGLLLAAMITGYGVGVTVNILETFPELIGSTPVTGAGDWTIWTYDLGRTGVATGHLCLVLLLMRLRPLGFLITSLQAAGRLALTNYVVQTIFCTWLFFGHGLSWFGELNHEELLVIAIAFGLAQIVMSRLYFIRFRQGPLEWLLRKIVRWDFKKAGTDGKTPPVPGSPVTPVSPA